MPSFKDELQVLSRCIQEGQGLLLTGYATDADDKWSLEIYREGMNEMAPLGSF